MTTAHASPLVVGPLLALALVLGAPGARAETDPSSAESAPPRADGSLVITSWDRVRGRSDGPDLVPTLRARAFYRPLPSAPLELYAAGQVTREALPRGIVGLPLPKVDVDDYAILAIGARIRPLHWFELFAQAGPALGLLPGDVRFSYDVRWGAIANPETRDCAPAPARGVELRLLPCAELFAEGIYATRLNNNVMGYARPRAAAGYLRTGPVLWQLLAEVNAAKDLSGDYWNNFADVGAGQRWRLLAPFRFDLIVTANTGTYFGISNHTPAPSQLTYDDIRVIGATYVEL